LKKRIRAHKTMIYATLLKMLYRPGLAIFGLGYLPHFIARLGQTSDKKRLLLERFGYAPNHFENHEVVWIHAVSVGEVRAVSELVQLIKMAHPEIHIVLSTTTPTGQNLAKQMESERLRAIYFPFDFSSAVKRMFNVIRPKCIIVMETEIWPNFITCASERGIPIGIINGRISNRAFKRYLWVKPWFRELLEKLSFCLVRNEEDRSRFVSIGMPPGQIQVTGNMKFDVEAEGNPKEANRLRGTHGWKDNLVLVGGSTHEGEEAILMNAFKKLRTEFPNLKLVIAPRHVERSQQIMQLANQSRLKSVFASQKSNSEFDILILDFVGILSAYYGIADLVFVGGSLVPHGGQNPIEPARERKVIFYGPHIFNFEDIYQKLNDSEAAVLVRDGDTFCDQAVSILKDRQRMRTIGERAFQVVDQLKGATQRNLTVLEPWLKSSLHFQTTWNEHQR